MKLAIHGGKPVRSKPFDAQSPSGGSAELRMIAKSLKRPSLTYGAIGPTIGGPRYFCEEFEDRFASYHHARYAVAMNNGTVSLAAALRAAGVDCGDEVIFQPYTCFANVEAVIQIGAIPVFADIDADTYCVDVSKIEAKITGKTGAIVAIHWAGRPADLDALRRIARRKGLALVEDACVAQGAEWKGRRVGAFGGFGVFSFGWGKLMSCGEGGMIVTNNRDSAEKCRMMRNRGRNRKGEPTIIGWNGRISEMLAAFLLEKLRGYEAVLEKRTRNINYLMKRLAGIPGIRMLKNDKRITQNAYCRFTLKFNEHEFGASRNRFIKAAAAEGLSFGDSVFPMPLYRHVFFRNNGVMDMHMSHLKGYRRRNDYTLSAYPACETAYQREALSLSHTCLQGSAHDMDDVISVFEKLRENVDELRK